jgi:glycosyltransferase 2 family protein
VKSGVFRVLRLALSLSILGALFFYIGVGEVFDQLNNLDPFYFVFFLVISYPLIWSSCRKWKLFIPNSSEQPSTGRLMRYYTISYFANLFLPSTLGGDAARSYKLGRYLKSQTDALAATFLERLTGLLAMVIIALVVVLSGFSVVPEFSVPVLFVSFGVIGVSWVFLSRRGVAVFFAVMRVVQGKVVSRDFLSRIVEKILSVQHLLHASRAVFWKALGWSFVFHALTIGNTYLGAKAVGWDSVSVLQLCIVVPLVLLISMIPVTPGGIGVQEGAFVFLLTRIGASSPEALSVALLLRGKTLLLGVLGGVFFLKKE